MASQFEIRASIPSELANRLEEHFLEVETSEWGILKRELGDLYEVFGFFPDKTTANKTLEALRREFPALPEDFTGNTVEESFWQNAYKEFIKPWNYRQLYWIPLWERKAIKPSKEMSVVYLDAGMAFGTGTHETTRLCARRLLDYFESRPSGSMNSLEIIDAGCGSGILALSAASTRLHKYPRL